MGTVNKLSSLTQEGLVALYCWDDGPKGAKFVRAVVPPAMFDPFWKEIAQAASEYLDRYGVPPKDDTASIIETLASRAGEKRGATYFRLFESLKETKDTLNREFVLDQAEAFARFQRMNMGVTKALDGLAKESVEGVEEAEQALAEVLRPTSSLFDPGTLFTDPVRALAFLNEEDECWPTGIKEVDRYGLGPGPGRLHLFLAPMKMGKSWWLIHLAKKTILSGRSVVYITLEMSEKLVTKRLFQSFFAMTKREADNLLRVKFDEDKDLGRFIDFKQVAIAKRPAFDSRNVESRLHAFQGRLKNRPKLLVKQFPTGDLTLRGLDGYLTGLEGQGFGPKLVIIDYADLMHLDTKNLRASTQEVYRGLRGLAVRRHLGVATASQANRSSMTAKQTDTHHAAEDIGKIAIADVVMTLSRTDAERQLGLARLGVGAAREDVDRMTILLAQSYATGQFCTDSTLFAKSYWDRVNGDQDNGEEEDDE